MKEETKSKAEILKDLQEKVDYVKKEHSDLNIVAIYLQGSQNYGLDDEQSDIDAKAFVIPCLDDLVRNKKLISKTYIMPDNSHVEVKDIRLFVDLLKKQNPTYLELLCTEYFIYYDKSFKKIIQKYKEYFLVPTKKFMYACRGMMYEKLESCDKKRKGNEKDFDKFGYDPKVLSHMYRLLYMMNEVMLEGNIEYRPISIERTVLMAIKRGKHLPTNGSMSAWLNKFEEDFGKKVDSYPATVDNDKSNEFQEEIYQFITKNIQKNKK